MISLYEGRPLLDLVSHGRGAPDKRLSLSGAQIEQITRTVRRAPEVVVKVLPKDSNNAKAIRNHIAYIGRHGKLELEGDDGAPVSGKKAGEELLDDWDLDLETHRRESEFKSTRGRPAPKLVHKLVLSMPPGTPSDGVLAAVRDFAREEFALKHRYAMVLHTDEPHPHVHLVVKAVSEQGERLTVRKATLRAWRAEFARHLRAHGIAANATERAVRGESRSPKRAGIYRAARRGESTHVRARVETVAAELLNGDVRVGTSMTRLVQTRTNVERGWRAISRALADDGQRELAADVDRFRAEMRPPRTEKQWIARELHQRVRVASPRDQYPVR